VFGAADRGGCAGVIAIIFVLTLLVIPPTLLLVSESIRHDTFTSLIELLQDDIKELGGSNIHAGDMVHAVSDDIFVTPGAFDPEMAVVIQNALLLKRQTEYCQWQEFQTETCETCTRTIRAKDGTVKEEQYACNCFISYSYTKSWRSHRINSALFNQPGAHNNPLRDPLPPATFVAPSATLRVGNKNEKSANWWSRITTQRNAIDEITMDDNMIQSTKSLFRRVKWNPRGSPPKKGWIKEMLPSWFPKDKTRFESTDSLKNTPNSPAALEHGFVYAGKGYFYSSYQETRSEALFKYFMEYMEGSLMDWQLGDLVKSCTAVDVRVYYQVADPSVVSVLGEVKYRKPHSLELMPKTTETGLAVGLVHAGIWSAEQMISREDSDAWWTAVVFRILTFIWSIPMCRLLGAFFGKRVVDANTETKIFQAISTWCILLGFIWRIVWGSSKHNTTLIACAFAMLAICFKWYTPAGKSPPGVRAVWCMVGRWAGVPPSWRTETSYAKEERKRHE
jgi:hypothetical protein